MPKIVKKPDAEWESKKWKCSGCKAEMHFLAKDIQYGCSGMDNSGVGYYAECPYCKEQKEFGEKSLPFLVRQAADKRYQRAMNR